MDKQTAIEKIRKCLALAKSANEHEAAAALRQAQALMRKYGVEDGDILMAEVSEARVRAGAKTKPVKWESMLSSAVAVAFGCRKVFVQEWKAGYWTFIGCGPAAEIATYAYTVLMRQLRKARSDYQQTHCKRLVPASKTRRADLFCEAWVAAVRRQIEAFPGTQANEEALEVYMAKEYPDLGTLVPRDRQAGKNLRDGDMNARTAGWSAGRQAQLNHGVHNKPLALGN
ncbi:DUF2786 domain-containing protein [Gulbenkiania mobilis]|uniref:DUF2786 domain-containing protein n=1 Tax=Gulbenkiania mobilis TaxID=397457 RepID=UPI0006BBED03|nr:DUF2786 domain-containing protein [Gulbenkiania mobilis]